MRPKSNPDSSTSALRATTNPNADPPGRFAAVAPIIRAAGLLPIPCCPVTAKKPLVRFKDADQWLTEKHLESWMAHEKFNNANIGFLTGAGRQPVVVVDIDDAAFLEQVLTQFGPTPMQVRTPSGGTHLYYSYRGERCRNLRRLGLPVDVKGKGGFIVAPPSRPFSAVPTGPRVYRFDAGGWDDVSSLPPIAETARRFLARGSGLVDRNEGHAAAPELCTASDTNSRMIVREGARNDFCFRQSLLFAPIAGSADRLLTTLIDVNRQICLPPLERTELRQIVASAWAYEQRGENWCRGQGVTQITTTEAKRLRTPDAVALLVCLRQAHGSRNEAFALAPRAMAAGRVVWGLGERAIRAARDELLELQLLECVHRGGRGPGDPSLFRLPPRSLGG